MQRSLTVSHAVRKVGVGDGFLEEVEHRLEEGGALRRALWV